MAGSKFATEYNFNVGGHMAAGRQGHKVDRVVIHHNANTTWFLAFGSPAPVRRTIRSPRPLSASA